MNTRNIRHFDTHKSRHKRDRSRDKRSTQKYSTTTSKRRFVEDEIYGLYEQIKYYKACYNNLQINFNDTVNTNNKIVKNLSTFITKTKSDAFSGYIYDSLFNSILQSINHQQLQITFKIDILQKEIRELKLTYLM